MTKPAVTVAIPVYNGSATLERAVRSALDQTFGNLEVLAINDGSADSSEEVLSSINDPRVRIISHTQNRGLAQTRNHLVQESRGEIVVWLDQDDVSNRDRVERQMRAFRANPRLGICGSWTHLISQGTRSWHKRVGRDIFEWGRGDDASIRANLPFRNVFSTSTTAIRREVAIEHGIKFIDSYAPAEDYEFWTRMTLVSECLVIERVLGDIWEYPTGASSRGRERQMLSARKVREEILGTNGLQLSDSEKAAHAVACEVLLVPTSWEEHLDAALWLDRLVEWNEATAAFDRRAFRSACAERLAIVMLRCCQQHPRRLPKLVDSSRIWASIPRVMRTRAISRITALAGH